jgi:cytohesin
MLTGLKATQILIENGADVNERNPIGATALMWASCIGPPEVIQYLLENGADVNAKSPEGQTALADAAASDYAPKRLEVTKLLLQHGADIDARDAQGLTPLMKAMATGHTEIAEYLRNSGAKGTPANLYQAVFVNDVDLAKSFIKSGHDVNDADENGVTALMCACKSGRMELVKLLLNHGAKVNATDKTGSTPLLHACSAYMMVKRLVRRFLSGKGGMQSSESQRVGFRIAKLLIDKGADINARGADGITPLMMACQFGDHHIVKLLLEKGVDIKAKDEDGDSAIQYAGGKEHILRLLLEHAENQKN